MAWCGCGIDVAADNGGTVDVRTGLRAGDRLILNPPISATDGMRVTTASQFIRVQEATQ